MVRKFCLKGINITIIVVIILALISPIFVTPGHAIKLKEGLYNKKNSYEVLLMGSSHMNGLIDPEILYDNYGISSFNYGTGGQPIDVTYYLLNEALKIHPETQIVVLDLYYIGLKNEYGEEGYIRNVLDNMRLSYNKLHAIENCTPKSDFIYYLFPILKYHDRWSSLSKNKQNNGENSKITGFEAGTQKYGEEIKGNQYSEEIGDIPPKSKEYLYKFIELSKQKGFKLIFVNAPYDYSSNDFEHWYIDDAAMYNRVNQIAEENNIPFINYSSDEKMKEINFDFKEDMNNVGHTNIWGAKKVSLDLAEFLHNNYKLTDYR
ncbi:hypothetical protein UT300005_22280 [Clostridium sp. CTA-5]